MNIHKLIDEAYKNITRVKGNSYAPSVHEIQHYITTKLINDDKSRNQKQIRTDFSRGSS